MFSATTGTDQQTFTEYATHAWPRLYRYAYLLTGQHADAEDVAQQTLVRAHQAWSRVAAADSPDAYVRRILTNVFLSSKRPRARRLELLTDEVPEAVSSGPSSEPALLWPHVKELPPRQRAVVVLRYYEGLSEAEIADVLEVSPGTVKSNAHKALKSLRAALEAEGHRPNRSADPRKEDQ